MYKDTVHEVSFGWCERLLREGSRYLLVVERLVAGCGDTCARRGTASRGGEGVRKSMYMSVEYKRQDFGGRLFVHEDQPLGRERGGGASVVPGELGELRKFDGGGGGIEAGDVDGFVVAVDEES